MSAKILNGKLVAEKILKKVKRDVFALKRKGVHPKLAIILLGRNPGSLAYISQKEKACRKVGIEFKQFNFKSSIKTRELIKKIESLNKNKFYHGILVQLPLPSHIKTPEIIKAINPYKDVDGFHAYNLGKMFLSTAFEDLTPCTPMGVIKLLDFYKINVAGKETVIVGRSNITGKPLSIMLLNRNATVTVCHKLTKNLKKHAQQADILCVAAGVPGLIKSDMVKKGAVVVDIGFTRKNNKIFGDVIFNSVKNKAKYITPVPGGVGPMTVACLMENIVKAARRLGQD